MGEASVIMGVAVKHDGKTTCMPKPHRHCDLIRILAGHTKNFPIQGGDCQGFVDDVGKYYTRSQAMDFAIKHGLVVDGKTINSKHLFSEDLW